MSEIQTSLSFRSNAAKAVDDQVLRAAMRRRGTKIRVAHIAQLLAEGL